MTINSYSELLTYLEENMNTKIILFDKKEKNIKEVGYILNNDEENKVFIDKEFFLLHKKDLQEFFFEMLKRNLDVYKIPNMLVTEELIDYVVKNEELAKTMFYFYGLENENIDDELRKKLEQSDKYVVLNNELISTLSGNIYKRLFEMDYVVYDVFKLTDKDIVKFSLLGTHTKIKLVANLELDDRIRDNYLNNESVSIFEYDERKYLKKVLEILQELKGFDRNFDIVILVNNRELLKQSGILNNNDFNIFLSDNTIVYTKEEYELEDKKLEELVSPIKELNLSPFERYLAVYNIVKKFKPYKENSANPYESRHLKYILDNEYMTCYGFSKLLKALLEKVGISSFVTVNNIDHSYSDGFTYEEIPTDFQKHGHARNIVKIDDDKYDIHGIYLADSTWDNFNEADLYSYAAVTFDKMKEAEKLEELKVFDLLMDFHNKDEFFEKFDYLVKKMQKPLSSGESLKKGAVFYQIYLKISDILRSLDYEKYHQIFKKYDKEMMLLNKGLNENNSQMFMKFLNEYIEYMLPLVNKTIVKGKIIAAGLVLKKIVDKYDREKLKNWFYFTSDVYDAIGDVEFPYMYDPENPRNNYLELKESNNKKR